MNLTVSKIEAGDIGIISDYIISEYQKYTQDIDTWKISKRLEFDIRDYDSIKIEDENKKILAFSIFNKNAQGKAILISFFVSKEHRHSKASYLLSLHTSKELIDKQTFYFPINEEQNLQLPQKYCHKHKVDMQTLYDNILKVSNRWER